jgi:hypothetical protein
MLMRAESAATRAWFVADFVPEILDFVFATWDTFRLRPSVRLEQRITNLLSDAIEHAYDEQGKCWFIVPDMKRTDRRTGKELARHDIRFFHRYVSGQRLYFVFECKRLNVVRGERRIPNSSAYTAGMFCFVSQKYGAGHPCGGMIGYVMDGDVASARAAVEARIVKRRSQLQMLACGGYCPSPLMPTHPDNGETRHQRTEGEFVIYHLLLPVGFLPEGPP